MLCGYRDQRFFSESPAKPITPCGALLFKILDSRSVSGRFDLYQHTPGGMLCRPVNLLTVISGPGRILHQDRQSSKNKCCFPLWYAERYRAEKQHSKKKEALQEGRSKRQSGVSEKPSEAYPSFSLAGKPATILSYSEFSDISKASS